jgi:membrane-associated progesterone receptor component
VFDVSGKETYAPGKGYHGLPVLISYSLCRHQLTSPLVFAGKEPNRALGLSSLKPEDCIPDFSALSDKEKQVLNDWHTFFSKRYNIVGRLQPEGANL